MNYSSRNNKFEIQFNSIEIQKVVDPSAELALQRIQQEPLLRKVKEGIHQLDPEDLREELFLHVNIHGITKYRRFALPSLSDDIYFSILHELSKISSASLLVCYAGFYSSSAYYIPSASRITEPNEFQLAPIFVKIKKNLISSENKSNQPHFIEIYEAYTFLPICSVVRKDTGEVLCYCKN